MLTVWYNVSKIGTDNMKYNETIKEILKKNNGIITSTICNEHKIPHVYLTRLVKNNILIRLERGIYADNTGNYDDYYFFQVRFNKCVFSFQSALFFHGLTDLVPFQKEVTLYKGYNPHTIPSDVLVHFANKNIYELGIVEIETQFGNHIKIYDKEKTICDVIKSRKDMDVEIFKKAIKKYLENEDKDLNRLYQYAEQLGIVNELNDIVEVLYE